MKQIFDELLLPFLLTGHEKSFSGFPAAIPEDGITAERRRSNHSGRNSSIRSGGSAQENSASDLVLPVGLFFLSCFAGYSLLYWMWNQKVESQLSLTIAGKKFDVRRTSCTAYPMRQQLATFSCEKDCPEIKPHRESEARNTSNVVLPFFSSHSVSKLVRYTSRAGLVDRPSVFVLPVDALREAKEILKTSFQSFSSNIKDLESGVKALESELNSNTVGKFRVSDNLEFVLVPNDIGSPGLVALSCALLQSPDSNWIVDSRTTDAQEISYSLIADAAQAVRSSSADKTGPGVVFCNICKPPVADQTLNGNIRKRRLISMARDAPTWEDNGAEKIVSISSFHSALPATTSKTRSCVDVKLMGTGFEWKTKPVRASLVKYGEIDGTFYVRVYEDNQNNVDTVVGQVCYLLHDYLSKIKKTSPDRQPTLQINLPFELAKSKTYGMFHRVALANGADIVHAAREFDLEEKTEEEESGGTGNQ